MDRKERILKYMQSKEYVPLKFGELMTVLDVPRQEDAELLELLESLCDEGSIYVTKKGRYVSVDENSRTVSGILQCNAKGYFGFVLNENGEDVFVPGDMLGYAIDGDRVLVKIDNVNKGRPEGHVIKILERSNKIIVGVVQKKKDDYYKVQPDNRQFYHKIRIMPEDMNSAKIGDRVCTEITEYSVNGKIYGKVIGILGSKDSIKSCVDGIIIENGIKSDFYMQTTEEAERIGGTIEKADLSDREDLRDRLIFTIDGADARDFDDAVSLKLMSNGNYYLGVHIADVSHYVRPKSALDKEAFERGTSVYLADRVIPMLPERLSCGICSLNPDEDRLTMSVFMEIDSAGNVVDHEIKESVIRSKARMTYDDVSAMLDGDGELCEKYNYLLPTLRLMSDLSAVLRDKRKRRGAIMFEFGETGIQVDKDSNPTDIFYEERGVSHKIIEEFMLAANETVAEYAYWAELPFVYRVHETPSSDKLTAFNEFINHFGLLIKGRIDNDHSVHPKALQKVLDDCSGTPEENMIARAMLRSLMKADYRSENLGHFGLAAKYYCHFTSPIRRYPDLAVHRILKSYIHSKTKDMKPFVRFANEAAAHSSEREAAAVQAERDVEDLMKAAYMSDCVGHSYDAIVSGITSFGMFVTLENSVEGLIRIENMTGDYYEYDEATQSLTGQKKRRVYQVGNAVRVTLMRADIMLRRIDFVLEKDADKKMYKHFEIKTSTKLKNQVGAHKRRKKGSKHGKQK